MNFVRRLSTWKYFIVLKSDQTVIGDTSVTIVDAGIDVNNPYPLLTFPTPTTTTINGLNAFVFTSNESNIPFSEVSKLGLRLKKNISSVLTSIIDNLPNPTIAYVSADPALLSITHIYVYI